MGALSSQLFTTPLRVVNNNNRVSTDSLLYNYLDEHPELMVLLMQEYNKTLSTIERNRFEAAFLEDDYVHKFFEYYQNTYIDHKYISDDAIRFAHVRYEERGWNVVVSFTVQTDDVMFAPHPHQVCCAVRSLVGEEYLTLLRYMNEVRESSRHDNSSAYSTDYALVYKACQTTSITEEELVEFFSRDGFKVIKESQYS